MGTHSVDLIWGGSCRTGATVGTVREEGFPVSKFSNERGRIRGWQEISYCDLT